MPFKGNLKGHEIQIFEITVSSYNQSAILTIMFNICYKFVSQSENYKQSLNNYNVNKDKLDGIFLINECGNYKPVRICLYPQSFMWVPNISYKGFGYSPFFTKHTWFSSNVSIDLVTNSENKFAKNCT